jgi:hypothetical protein
MSTREQIEEFAQERLRLCLVAETWSQTKPILEFDIKRKGLLSEEEEEMFRVCYQELCEESEEFQEHSRRRQARMDEARRELLARCR